MSEPNSSTLRPRGPAKDPSVSRLSTQHGDQPEVSAADNRTGVARFDIYFWRYLNADGVLVDALPEWAADTDQLRELYKNMAQVRTFDARAVALQRTGQLGTYASSLGQEAVGAALGHVLAPEDALFPTYRETLALLMRGVRMHELLLYWGGDERGMAWSGQPHDFPLCVPIATQVPHAVGVAHAFRYRGEPRVAVCTIGDGGSSKGDFYEGLNLAGAAQLPVVFVVVNNQWAISVPRHQQSGALTLAQKAIAAGVPGEQVDGNDIIGMCERLRHAVDNAREGRGPRLIEAVTYRMSDHTTADDASRYRPAEELQQAWKREPMLRLRRYLEGLNAWSDDDEVALREECERLVEAEVAIYAETPAMPPESMFECLYETMPPALQAQRDALVASTRRDGGPANEMVEEPGNE